METLSVPGIQINNSAYAIVPNTFKFVPGRGEVNTRAASSGGGESESVHSRNAETNISKVMFDMFVTNDTLGVYEQVKGRVGTNSIQALQENNDGSTVTLVFDNMSMTNDPEFEATSDGVVSFEFSGDPMVRQ